MAWLPIQLTVPQYEDTNGNPYSGAVLKAYAAGTSTNIPFATDSTGATQVSSIALNANGYPAVSGNIVIPHIDQSFKLALYPTQAAADANSGAIWNPDDLTPVSNVGFGNGVNPQTVTYALLGADEGKLILFTGAGGVELDLLAVADADEGFAFLVENNTSGTVTLDPSGSELVNGAATFALLAGESAIVICTGSAWRALVLSNVRTNTANTFTAVQTMSGAAINFAEGSDVTSAATTNIWSTTGNTVHVTGSTGPITSLGTAPQAGASRWVIFDSTPTLTHGANLNIQGGANVTAAAGDFAYVYADTTTQHDVLFFRASGVALGAVYPANEGCAWDLIATSDIASSAADIYTNLNDTYAGYVWVISRLRPVTDNVDLTISLSTDNGSTYLAGTTYQFIRESTDTSGTETIVGSTGTSVFTLAVGQGNGAQETINGIVTVLGLDNPDDCAVFADLTSKSAASVYSHVHFAGVNTNGDVDALKFAFSSGNITSARITQYGIRRT